MGEEEKKPEEKKKQEAPKSDEKLKDDNKEANKSEEESKGSKESKDATPPPLPPPQEIILRVYMHCEGCARKVRRCLKGFEGVENVETDCTTHKVVVKGEKADPLKILERVQRKSHRQVELLSPIPKPPPPASEEEGKKPEEKEVAKPEEKKKEPEVVTVVLKVHMHCEACAQEIKRRIQKMEGVESVEPDLKSSEVSVKGSFDPLKLIDFIYKRTGKHAVIVKVEPEKKEEEKAKEGKEETKAGNAGEGAEQKDAKEAGEDGKEKTKGGKDEGGDQPAKQETEQEDPKLEMKKNEFYYNYPQNYQLDHQRFIQQELYAYPPQIFSDENPNACSVM